MPDLNSIRQLFFFCILGGLLHKTSFRPTEIVSSGLDLLYGHFGQTMILDGIPRIKKPTGIPFYAISRQNFEGFSNNRTNSNH